jgi:hypothetical protein
MSERRDRRRLHARARALGVPIEQAVRRHAPRQRPARQQPEPIWPRTALPDRDEPLSAAPYGAAPDRDGLDRDGLDRDELDRDELDATAPHNAVPVTTPASVVCCAATRHRQVLDGGTIVMLTRHAGDCPVWSAR